jgi:hypothetical protein
MNFSLIFDLVIFSSLLIRTQKDDKDVILFILDFWMDGGGFMRVGVDGVGRNFVRNMRFLEGRI